MEAYEARVNVTYNGQNGDLADPVLFESTPEQVLAIVTEAVRTGSVPGIPADTTADFEGFVVDRYALNEAIDYNRIFVRPKVPFGAGV